MYVDSYKIKQNGKGFLWIAIFTIVINPLTYHRGSHILFYVWDNPITLEAFLYGVDIAVMLLTLLSVFLVFNQLIDSERFLYLFGKKFPKMAFILNMCIRFMDVFRKRGKNILEVAKTRETQGEKTRFVAKIKRAGILLNALVRWCLEEGMLMSDVLKAKQYATVKRTAYHFYPWNKTDSVLFIGELALLTIALVLFYCGAGYYQFYPRFMSLSFSVQDTLAYIIMLLFSCMPMLLESMNLMQRRKNKVYDRV